MSLFVCHLSYLELLWQKRGVNHRGDKEFVMVRFLFQVASGFLPVLFSLFSSVFSALMFLDLMFWSLEETVLVTVVVPASVRLLLVLFLVMFHQHSAVSLFFPFYSLSLSLCFIAHHIVVIVSLLSMLLSLIFHVSPSLFSGLFSFFLCQD